LEGGFYGVIRLAVLGIALFLVGAVGVLKLSAEGRLFEGLIALLAILLIWLCLTPPPTQ